MPADTIRVHHLLGLLRRHKLVTLRPFARRLEETRLMLGRMTAIVRDQEKWRRLDPEDREYLRTIAYAIMRGGTEEFQKPLWLRALTILRRVPEWIVSLVILLSGQRRRFMAMVMAALDLAEAVATAVERDSPALTAHLERTGAAALDETGPRRIVPPEHLREA